MSDLLSDISCSGGVAAAVIKVVISEYLWSISLPIARPIVCPSFCKFGVILENHVFATSYMLVSLELVQSSIYELLRSFLPLPGMVVMMVNIAMVPTPSGFSGDASFVEFLFI